MRWSNCLLLLLLWPLSATAGGALAQLNSLRLQLASDIERQAPQLGGDRSRQLVEQRVMPWFDIDAISQRLVGPAWLAMPAWQRAQASGAVAQHAVQRLAAEIGKAPDKTAQALRSVQLRAGGSDREQRLARVFFGLGRLDLATRTFSVQLHRGADRRWRLLDVQLLGNSTLAAYRQALQRQARKLGWQRAFQWLRSLGGEDPTTAVASSG